MNLRKGRKTTSKPSRDVRFARADYPALYAASAHAAVTNHRLSDWLARVELGLLLIASLLVAVEPESESDWTRWYRLGAAGALLLALVLKFGSRLKQFNAIWLDARALAEAVKSRSWLYAMKVQPFNIDNCQADLLFRDELRKLLSSFPLVQHELHRMPPEQRQISDRMRETRALQLRDRIKVYEAARIDDQIAWYHRKSRSSHKRATQWFVFSLLALLAALSIAVFRVADVDGVLAKAVKFTIAVSIAATALNQWSRYGEAAREYGIAGEALASTQIALHVAEDEETFQRIVQESEAAISNEHHAWFHRRV